MLTIVIRSAKQGILSNDWYLWLQRHFNTPLKVMSLNFSRWTGKIDIITIYTEDSCLTLFVDGNDPDYGLYDDSIVLDAMSFYKCKGGTK